MKYKLGAFFSGRNGMDELGRTLLWGALIAMILGTLLGITVLYSGAFVLLCYVYIRAFSRNLEKCRRQNKRISHGVISRDCVFSSARLTDFTAVPTVNSSCVYPKERAGSPLPAAIAESALRRKPDER